MEGIAKNQVLGIVFYLRTYVYVISRCVIKRKTYIYVLGRERVKFLCDEGQKGGRGQHARFG